MSQTKLMVALRDAEHINDLLNLACHLTSAMQAELTAIHVVEVGPGLPLDLETEVLDQPGRMILSCACRAAAQNSTRIATALVRAHHVGQTIVNEAIHRRIDLLIMGYHQRHGVVGMVFGSTVQYVARHAPCRLLVEILPNTSTRLRNGRENKTVTAC